MYIESADTHTMQWGTGRKGTPLKLSTITQIRGGGGQVNTKCESRVKDVVQVIGRKT